MDGSSAVKLHRCRGATVGLQVVNMAPGRPVPGLDYCGIPARTEWEHYGEVSCKTRTLPQFAWNAFKGLDFCGSWGVLNRYMAQAWTLAGTTLPCLGDTGGRLGFRIKPLLSASTLAFG